MRGWRTAKLLRLLVVSVIGVFPFVACSHGPKPVNRKSTDELFDDLNSSDDRVRIAALQQLKVTQGRKITQALVILLNDDSQPVRLAAVAALSDLQDPAAAEALWGKLNSPYAGNRFKLAAARALAGMKDERAIQYLIQFLPDAPAEATAGLQQFGNEAIRPLIKALSDGRSRTPASAVLVSIGEPVIDPLIEAMSAESNRSTRLTMARVLAEFDNPRASAALQLALKDRAPDMIAATYRFLIRQGAAEFEPLLISVLSQMGRRDMAEDYAASGNPKLQKAAEAWAEATTGSSLKVRYSELDKVFWGGQQPDMKVVNLYHFDGKLVSVKGDGPVESKQVSYVDGKWGQAISVERGGMLTYSINRNLSFSDGTVEMWISPQFNGNDPVYRKYNHALLLYQAPKGGQFLVSEGNFGGFYAGTVVNQVFTGAGGGNFGAWAAGSWHHIAFTYSSRNNRQRLYLDGILTTERRGPMTAPDAANRNFTFGCDPYGNWTAFAIDEFQIWSEEMTAANVRSAASRKSANPDP